MEQKSANKWKERAKRLKSDVPAVFLALSVDIHVFRNHSLRRDVRRYEALDEVSDLLAGRKSSGLNWTARDVYPGETSPIIMKRNAGI